ncbi:MAG: hypothetical protein FJ264_11985 [Planctomycetes bacterium]|nr:hypothetical protein [Planctomycetota bacterium]
MSMSPRELTPQKPLSRFENAKRKIRNFVSTFGAYVAIAFWIVCAFVSFLDHFIPPVEQLPALVLVTALILILSEQNKEIKIELDEALLQVRREGRELQDQVGGLVANLDRPFYLLDCMTEYQRELSNVSSIQFVEIDHLGLDMQVAWEYIRGKILEPYGTNKKIKYRLLMLTGEFTEMRNLAEGAVNEIQGMCSSAKISLDKIKTILTNMKTQLKGLEIEIKTYNELPFVHGFKANKPHVVYYVGFCRWGGLKYDDYQWGEGKYHKIKGVPADSSIADLSHIFEGYFNHLWTVGTTVYRLPQSQGVHPNFL